MTGVAGPKGNVLLNSQLPVQTTNVTTLTLNGLGGDNVYGITGSALLPYTTTIVNGSGLPDPDVLNLTGNGTAVTANLGRARPRYGGGLGTVDISGVGTVNLNNVAGAISVSGTTAANAFLVTPTSGSSAAVQVAGEFPVLNATTTGTLTIDDTNPPDGDTATVNGTGGNDTIAVVRNATTDTVQVNSLITINVTSAAVSGTDRRHRAGRGYGERQRHGGTGVDRRRRPVAGERHTERDELCVGNHRRHAGGDERRRHDHNPDGLINFTGLKQANVTAAATTDTLTVNGTSGNDAITVARGTTLNLASVNAQATIGFSGFNVLNLSGGLGNDTFNVSPVGIVMAGVSPAINVAGAAGANGLLTVNGSAAADTINYTPTGSAAGGVTIASSTPVTFSNVPAVAINGQGGNDLLTITAPAASTTTYAPGATADSASVQVNNWAPLSFTNLGVAGTPQAVQIAAGAASNLVYNGTSGNDAFTVTGVAGPKGNVLLNSQLPVQTTNVTTLTLNGLGGDNVYGITGSALLPYTTTIVNGSGLPDPDVLNLTGNGTAVTANLGNATPTVVGGGLGTVNISGVGTVNLNNVGGPITVSGTTANSFLVTPTATNIAAVQVAGAFPVLNTTTTGTLTIANTNAPASGNTVTVNGTGGIDTINVVRNATTDTVQVNSLKTISITSADASGVVVATGLGADTVNVTGSAGATGPVLSVAGGQTPASDTLNVTNFTAGTTMVTPGATSDAGTIVSPSPDGTTNFSGMKQVNVTGAAATDTLTVNGTAGNDAISVARASGQNQVSVNAQATIGFTNFQTLSLVGLSGNDTFNVSPVGLVMTGVSPAINVAGSAGANGLLTVNGSAAADTINYTPTASAAGGVTIASSTPVNFTNVPAVAINGQGGSDAITYQSPANGIGSDLMYTPGDVPDSGAITGSQFGISTDLAPLAFTNLGTFGSVAIDTLNEGALDHLVLNGTAGSDIFNVGAANLQILKSQPTNIYVTLPMTAPGVDVLELRGLDGDDQFNLAASLPYTDTIVDGGNPSGSDTVNLTGATGDVAVSLGDSTIPTDTTVAGYGGTVTLTGIEVANLDANGHALTVTGTTGADSIAVTPTGANSASFQAYTGGTSQNGQGGTLASQTALAPVFNATAVAVGGFLINGNGGSDELFVEGTQNGDTINVNDATAGANAVAITGLLTVNYNAALPHVEIDSLAGSDTINIGPSTTTTFLVDGGDPIGVLPGDTLNLVHPALTPYAIFPGPTNDSGGLNTLGYQTVSWVHIESIINTGGVGSPLVIEGTNANDEITVIARDQSYNPLADGVQDFTVSVNDGPDMLFINEPNLFIDAMSGNDDIVVREPAPNLAVWNVHVYVAGGPPASGSDRLGDNLELETPGTKTVEYTPNNPVSDIPPAPDAVFTAPSTGGGQFSDAGDASTITATQFVITRLLHFLAGRRGTLHLRGRGRQRHPQLQHPEQRQRGQRPGLYAGGQPGRRDDHRHAGRRRPC